MKYYILWTSNQTGKTEIEEHNDKKEAEHFIGRILKCGAIFHGVVHGELKKAFIVMKDTDRE